MLAAAAGVPLDPRFGVGSALAHQASGAVPIEFVDIESLRRDVDTAADLAHADSWVLVLVLPTSCRWFSARPSAPKALPADDRLP